MKTWRGREEEVERGERERKGGLGVGAREEREANPLNTHS